MKAKELEHLLSSVKPFSNPKVTLEQYATDAHLASRMAHIGSTTFDDFEDKLVLDLGCGCGMLSIAALLAGAQHVVSVDIDQDALDQFEDNVIRVLDLEDPSEVENYFSIIKANVLELSQWNHQIKNSIGTFDTIVLNPPFGTKSNAGIDMAFLEVALSAIDKQKGGTIYTMHKTSTRDYILRRFGGQVKDIQVIAQMKFEIQNQFKFHKKEKVYVNVDLIRLYIEPSGK